MKNKTISVISRLTVVIIHLAILTGHWILIPIPIKTANRALSSSSGAARGFFCHNCSHF